MSESGLQQTGHSPPSRRAAAGWAAGWLGVLAFAVWMLRLAPEWLAVSAAGLLVWGVLVRGVPRGWRLAAGVVSLCALSIGGVVQFRLLEIRNDWDRVRTEAEDRAAERLGADLDELTARTERALDGAAAVAAARPTGDAALFAELSRVRREAGVSALALYDREGAPAAWSGDHRGTVPDSVRLGARWYSFSAGPLFGYVYFTERLPDGRVAMAAVLLEAHVAVGGARPFAERFAERNGLLPRFTNPVLADAAELSVWDWKLADGSRILSVVFATLTQEAWRERTAESGRWAAGAGWIVLLVLVAGAWFAGSAGPPGVPVAAVTASLLALPLEALSGTDGIFSPLRFVLPVPGDPTLGHFVILLGGLSAWLLSRHRPGRAVARVPLVLRVAAAAAALVGVQWLVRTSVADAVLARHPAGGLALVVATTLAAALPLFLLLGHAPRREGTAGTTRWIPVALALSPALSMGLLLWWRPGQTLPVWTPALWALPFAVLAASRPVARPGRGLLVPWLVMGWIAGTMALPHLWLMHVQARLQQAEHELSRLGARADPFLDFLLRQFAEKVLLFAAEGREGVPLLYQAWVEGGLAREGYEGRVTLWDGPIPAAELRLSEGQIPPERVAAVLAGARAAEEPLLERFTDQETMHYLLAVPLPGGRTVTVAVPPRRHLGRSTALARILDPAGETQSAGEATELTLVPAALASAQRAAPRDSMHWVETEEGWRSEATVAFPTGPQHAHLVVRVPSLPLLVVRGILALTAAVAGLMALWVTARTLCGEPLGLPARRWGWAWTFRGRLTLALFAFFLVPMAAFGATTYQALWREVVRTAAALAHRALGQAALEAQGATLSELSQHVGADLLLYHEGVLVEGASPEVIDLGLYPTWLPAGIYLEFREGEGLEAQEQERRLAGQEYLVAYRRLGPEDVLASPTPLASGEIARRQRELGSVVLLAGLLGGALSVVLSLGVGRALSRPIEDLSRAAAAVGSGNLGVRLPQERRDEFGRLFRSFNRMVRGLRQTRAALVRETRRTEAIVAEAGTGVVALDPAGRVALINRRACELLGMDVAVGERIPREAPLQETVAAAAERFMASGAREWAEEREVGEHVYRLRLRRLPAQKGSAGAVLVVEDVTAEIRSARVLAWGEMARQVAHEIKNPLTPIKLSVQHMRRAHHDGRADFGAILDRNVESILREIDRLGEIARAFARFGAPSDPSQPPEPTDAGRVVEETLALYRGGEDGIDYRVEVDAEAPLALARVGELKEVLVNLLENARAAIDGSGEVRITAAAAGGGAWLRLDVADTGEGIPAELLPRVFEPQFSTKSSGTGLGLAIVRRLVESWGGEVTVDSEPGVGTTVHLRLRAVSGDGGRPEDHVA